MKVILLEEVRGKGGEGDIITVADGFANNYLLREGKAVKATPGNLKQLQQRRKNIAKREEVRIADAENMKTLLEDGVITVAAKVGEEGQLFGSVTSQMIANAIQELKGIEVDRRRIDIRKPIKTVGAHEVEMSLYRDIKAVLKLNVVDEAAGEEAIAEAVDEAVEAAEIVEAAETLEAIDEAVAEAAAEVVAEDIAEAVAEAAEDATEEAAE